MSQDELVNKKLTFISVVFGQYGIKEEIFQEKDNYVLFQAPANFFIGPLSPSQIIYIKSEITKIFWFEGWMKRAHVTLESLKCYKQSVSESDERKNNIQGF